MAGQVKADLPLFMLISPGFLGNEDDSFFFSCSSIHPESPCYFLMVNWSVVASTVSIGEECGGSIDQLFSNSAVLNTWSLHSDEKNKVHAA